MDKKVRNCPLLEKYYVPVDGAEEQWQRDICLNCIVLPICVLELSGRVPAELNEILRNICIPCPKCQNDPVYFKEVMGGERISGLRKDQDGWTCFYCGFTIYKYKPIPKKESKPLKRIRKRLV